MKLTSNIQHRILSVLKYNFILGGVFFALTAVGQQDATFKEFTKTYLTYPFSDPDPVPPPHKLYPYFRFDGFTDKGVEKEWKVVVLENDYIRVQIMPEIGGKVWTAMDKKSGRHFFYNNGVVKFRDIAMRGPWVSGGIEVNYGIIGHTPNSATPVDYLVRSNEDGSVSCFTSTLDLLTRTRWVLEIKVEKDKAYFTTRSYWFNATGLEQPYYTWMNAGIPAGKDLRFLYPGNHYIGHNGGVKDWPEDEARRDLSYYAENDFAGSKSYHVLGVHSNYFGARWEEDDFGMIHYAKREDKLGKKIFLWAQSGQGRIWEDLLTDNSGQYVEIQSGRLFNQNQFRSSFTPFKQTGFTPYSSDSWIEYWYPFKGIEGFTAANLVGAFNIKKQEGSIFIRISPVQKINDSLRVYNEEGKLMAKALIKAEPLEAVACRLSVRKGETPVKIKLEGHILDLQSDDPDHFLSRPVRLADQFNENSAYGLYLQGRDLARFRNYTAAEEKITASLEEDPLFLPALVELAKLKLFRMQYDSAFYYARKSLSIDTYDGEANYYYGLAASKSSRYYDALDGFEVATLTPEFRNAGYTALSHLYMKRRDLTKAKEYTRLSLQQNPMNVDALQLLYILARVADDKKLLKETADKIRELNPLNHFLRFEEYYQAGSDENKNRFTRLIRSEMPRETYLELAIWYANLGRTEESKKVLELSPPDPETLYWLAWLNRKDEEESKKFLRQAQQAPALFVFPFREESATVLEWAASATDAWLPDYLLALIDDFRGNGEKALARLVKHDEKINFAPFYILRARLNDKGSLDSRLTDIATATDLAPEEWRYGRILAKMLIRLEKGQQAVRTLKKYYKSDRTNYIIGFDLVKAYMVTENYKKAEEVLSILHILPFEGATESRRCYREIKLMLARQAMENGKYQEALQKIKEAEEWPARLGVGKPYPERINDDLENWMRASVYKKTGDLALHQEYLQKVRNEKVDQDSYLEMIRSISSEADKRMF